MQIDVETIFEIVAFTPKTLLRTLKITKSKTVLSPPVKTNLISFSNFLYSFAKILLGFEIYSVSSEVFKESFFAIFKIARVLAIDNIKWSILCLGMD